MLAARMTSLRPRHGSLSRTARWARHQLQQADAGLLGEALRRPGVHDDRRVRGRLQRQHDDHRACGHARSLRDRFRGRARLVAGAGVRLRPSTRRRSSLTETVHERLATLAQHFLILGRRDGDRRRLPRDRGAATCSAAKSPARSPTSASTSTSGSSARWSPSSRVGMLRSTRRCASSARLRHAAWLHPERATAPPVRTNGWPRCAPTRTSTRSTRPSSTGTASRRSRSSSLSLVARFWRAGQAGAHRRGHDRGRNVRFAPVDLPDLAGGCRLTG